MRKGEMSIMIGKKIIKRIGAGIMAGLCAFSMFSTAMSGTLTAEAAAIQFPSKDKVIAQAAQLLGCKYTFGAKGGNPYATPHTLKNVSETMAQGIDCSGLVWWTLTNLGYKTSGFGQNSPVPADTFGWIGSTGTKTITYGGVTANVDIEKLKLPSPADKTASKTYDYWEKADGTTITAGSVVVGENPGGIDHCWIYMGEFASRAEVVTYLKEIGVPASKITTATVGDGKGDGGTHWRIEANGSEGVVINNKVNGKSTSAMNMYAFRVTPRNVTFSITKKDNAGNLVGKSSVDGSTAQYGVYTDKACTNRVAVITIGADGKGSVSLEEGTYYIKETKAPAGYALDTKVYTTAGGTVTSVEDRATGTVRINKTADDGIVSDREFRLNWTEESKAQSKTVKTDAGGTAVFSELNVYDRISGKAIKYTVSEINVDTRYSIPKAQDVYLTSGDKDFTVNVRFENKVKTGSIRINKQSEDGLIGDRTFEVTGNGRTYTAVTNSKGVAEFKELPVYDSSDKPIPYTISEKNVPVKYVVPASQTADLTADETVSRTFVNKLKKGYIAIIKHSDSDENVIENMEEGAEFQIYGKAYESYDAAPENERDKIITDSNGCGKTSALPCGTYIVHQTKTVADAEHAAVFEAEVTENGKTYEYVINNAPYQAFIRITKVDAETGKNISLSGAGFEIYKADGTKVVMTVDSKDYDTFYTDTNGIVMTPATLGYGKYSLVEVKAPEGYVLDSTPVAFEVTRANSTVENASNIVVITKKDAPQKGTISVEKIGEMFFGFDKDFETAPLSGAEFEVRAAEDIVTPDGTKRLSKGELAAVIITAEDGKAATEPLYLGKYTVKETKAPYGYVLNNKEQTVELTYAGQNIDVTNGADVQFRNEYQKVSINLKKYMEYDELFGIGNNTEYRAVCFGLFTDEEIKTADGNTVPKDYLVSELSLSEDMTSTFNKKIPFGKYYVKEIATDEHYVINDEKYLINYSYAGQEIKTVEIDCGTFVNDIKRGSVKGLKVDSSDVPLEDALFGLFKADEAEFSEENALMTAVSDSNGNFEFGEIAFGKYAVKEIKAPDGYKLSDKTYDINISKDKETIEIKAENDSIDVDVSKQDVYGNELEGAKMQLIDKDGIIIDEWVSAKEKHTVTKLKAGEYTLKEAAAPAGFVITTDISFSVDEYGKVTVNGVEAAATDDSGNPTIVMVDDTTKVRLSKRDITNGEELPGAKLIILDENGKPVEEWISSNKPHYIEGRLTAGKTYTLREITAPEGYEIANDIQFTVDSDGSVTEVVMEDEHTHAPIPENHQPQTGAGSDSSGIIYAAAALVIGVLMLIVLRKKAK